MGTYYKCKLCENQPKNEQTNKWYNCQARQHGLAVLCLALVLFWLDLKIDQKKLTTLSLALVAMSQDDIFDPVTHQKNNVQTNV